MPTALEIQDVLLAYQTELGQLSHRAIMAETSSKHLEKQNEELQQEVGRLTQDNDQLRLDLSAQLAVHASADHIEKPAQEVPAAFKGSKAAAKP